jgi:succinylarginine dihydrolase
MIESRCFGSLLSRTSFEVEQCDHDLWSGDVDPEHQGPALGDRLEDIGRLTVLMPAQRHETSGVLEKLGPVHRGPPVLSAQWSNAMASASSSAGSMSTAWTAAITVSVSALLRPVT